MIDIRAATPGDVASIVDILEELDRFYGVTDFPALDVRRQQVDVLLFGPQPAAHLVLAKEETHTIGLASYSLLWPAAGVTASLYLKELYVRRSRRRRGVGAQLMAHICSIAVEAGCSRVEWTTDRDNPDAQAFYEQLGAPVTTEKVMYRVDPANLIRLAHRHSAADPLADSSTQPRT